MTWRVKTREMADRSLSILRTLSPVRENEQTLARIRMNDRGDEEGIENDSLNFT